jgi:hypothetical protein
LYDSSWKEINDTFNLTNYLLYDYNLQAGDTFFIEDPFGFGFETSWIEDQDSFLILDSVENQTLLNSTESITQYFKYTSYSDGYPYINRQFLGATPGALGHLTAYIGNLSSGSSTYTSLVSACANQEELLRTKNGYWSRYFDTDVCNEDSLRLGYEHVVSTDKIDQTETIYIWPNPTTRKLYHNLKTTIDYQITDQIGQVIDSGKSTNKIDVTHLSNGIYSIIISLNNQSSYHRFIKE